MTNQNVKLKMLILSLGLCFLHFNFLFTVALSFCILIFDFAWDLVLEI
jgi:hypothetical protein